MKLVLDAVTSACGRIAPTWPLDRFIAVNPYWGFTDQSIEQTAETLFKLCGSPLLPAREEVRVSRMPLCSDFLEGDGPEKMVHSISQSCAAFFDQGQARWRPAQEQGLYRFWLSHAPYDHGLLRLCGSDGLTLLAQDHRELLPRAISALELDRPGLENYLTALLLSINGWAAWCAYLGWQARLEGKQDDTLEQLLAIRLAWEWLVYQRSASDPGRRNSWRAQLQREMECTPLAEVSADWSRQKGLEIDYQESVLRQLSLGPARRLPERPVLQAVFCIDVRSEVFRRALESCHPNVQTLGFAGFFGIPAAYTPLGTQATRPQLPGLLAPSLTLEDTSPQSSLLASKRRQRLQRQGDWESFGGESLSTFHFVESLGLSYAWRLLTGSLGWQRPHPSEEFGLSRQEKGSLRPALVGLSESRSITLASGVLRAMSLTDNFAPLVLLLGHGSSSINNPHASGLDCGACCGQSGEVNSRALADLLNDAKVRQGLAGQGICIPPSTRFVAGLHNTTSDDITLFDDQKIDEEVRQWLQKAAHQARSERASALGLDATDSNALASACRQRTRDWSQVRPEWGLANNAGFLAAPRARSREMNLQGRCFLHEYSAEKDPDGAILEQIMTAPMIVAHWINMQYYASVVDNLRWGSGNKVLHNVVGGNLGVFEGNGGDLRIGLPLQSLHDGKRWMHTPLRLSVWLEATQAAIDEVIARHEKVRQLVEGHWIHLLRIDPQTGEAFRYQGAGVWATSACCQGAAHLGVAQ